jgi:hypothetical protein
LLRGDHQHTAPLAHDHERHADLRADGERFLDAADLLRVGIETAGEKRLAGAMAPHDAPAVGERQHVEAMLALFGRQRLFHRPS